MKRRVILLTPLLALFAFVATTEERVEAADVATPVEGESFGTKPAGHSIISGAGYSAGAALKFTQNNTASHTINCSTATCDVVLMAGGGQSGGQPTLRVNGSPAQALRSTTVMAYTFDVNLPAGQQNTINVTAGNTGTGRNVILDVVTFPTSDGGGGTDTTPPETTITSGPSGSLTGTTATFEFASNETGSTFQCRLLPLESSRTSCSSSKTYTNLTVGTAYTFKVWATDIAGNIDASPATSTFTPSGDGSTPPPTWNCTGTQIRPRDDLDAIINQKHPTGTRFCVHAGTYQISEPAILKTGDKLDGQPGTKTAVDTATKPTPVVKLEGSGTPNLLRANGTGISISWVDLTGASGTGTGSGAITAGSASSDFLVQFARIHENASLGISNMKGRVLDSEFFSNSKDPSSLGFNGSAVKGITEFEAGRVYVHDEQGNGLWCDVGCSNDPARVNGFWVYDSVIVNSNRAGIRYENSPNQALFENNELHSNGKTELRGGIDIRDSQNARVINNNLGPATIAGVSYLANGDRIGIRATDSGRSDRVNLWNVDVVNNKMNLDRIVTCGGQVACSGNTSVGSR